MPWKRPHIIIIVADCMRAQSLSCYGYARSTTPHIDRVAEEGTRFQNATTPAPWTVPAHASLFTGTYPETHGAINGHALLDNRLVTLAEALVGQGYRAVGMANNGWVSKATGLIRGFQVFEEKYRFPKRGLRHLALKGYRRLLALVKGIRYDATYRTNRAVLGWLKRMQTSDQPCVLFIHYNDAHSPYRPPAEFARRFLNGIPLGEARRVNQNNTPWLAGAIPMGEREFDALTGLYDAELAYLDSQLDTIFTALRQMRLLDDTLLIITGDHGEYLGDHGLIGHGYYLYDTLVHVPLIVRYPAVFPRGETLDTPVSLTDVFPTLLDVVGGWREDLTAQIEGASFHPERLGNRPYPFTVSQRHAYLPEMRQRFARYPEFDWTPYARNSRALRDGQWKYIWHEDGVEELYDLQADPGEMHNLAVTQPDVTTRLRAALQDFWLKRFENTQPMAEAEPELDDYLIEHLKELGYLE